MVFATERSADATQTTLHTIGFQVNVSARAAPDWHTVATVGLATLVLLIGSNIVFAVLVWAFGFPLPGFGDRNQILFYSVVEAALYTVATIIAMLMKRYASPRLSRANWNNFLIAMEAYAIAAAVYAGIQFYIRSYVTPSPLLFALDAGVVGYFIGWYIDRAPNYVQVSKSLACFQAGCQSLAGLIAAGLAPPPGSNLTPMQGFWIAMIVGVQGAILGAMIGILFQYLYGLTASSERQFVGALEGRSSLPGDLRIQLREVPEDAKTGSPRSYEPPPKRDSIADQP
jgi:hypothetical protein